MSFFVKILTKKINLNYQQKVNIAFDRFVEIIFFLVKFCFFSCFSPYCPVGIRTSFVRVSD
jgi:hypothetical protein